MFPVVFVNTHPAAGAATGIKAPPPLPLHVPSLAPALVEFTPIVRLFSCTVVGCMEVRALKYFDGLHYLKKTQKMCSMLPLRELTLNSKVKTRFLFGVRHWGGNIEQPIFFLKKWA